MTLPPTVPESEIVERFIRSSGPGGQNVNKVATAVELRFNVGASSLSDEIKSRVRTLAGKRLSVDDVVIIQAHEHRTQEQNRQAARARLTELIRRASHVPKPRRKTKPSAAAQERRLVAKQKRAAIKKDRRLHHFPE